MVIIKLCTCISFPIKHMILLQSAWLLAICCYVWFTLLELPTMSLRLLPTLFDKYPCDNNCNSWGMQQCHYISLVLHLFAFQLIKKLVSFHLLHSITASGLYLWWVAKLIAYIVWLTVIKSATSEDNKATLFTISLLELSICANISLILCVCSRQLEYSDMKIMC